MNAEVQADPHNILSEVVEEESAGTAPQSAVPEATSAEQAAKRGTWDPMLALAAFGLALIGQFFFANIRDGLHDGLLFFAIAIFFFFVLLERTETMLAEQSQESWIQQVTNRLRNAPVEAALVILSFAVAYAAVRLLKTKPGYGSYWDVFGLWIISSVCYLAAFVDPLRVHPRAWVRARRIEPLTVMGLTGLALALRLAALGDIPQILSGDEGKIGWLALDVLKGQLNNMMVTTFGHGTMYLFAIAGGMKLFGVNIAGVRLTSALAGGLTVLALYVIARRMFNVRVALIAAALLTVSHFHLHFSRIIAAGSIQDALFATVTFYFFYTGLEERSRARFALSGLVLGVHLYIYMGARLMMLLLPMYVLALLIVDRELVQRNLGNLLVFVGALIVVAAPMASWAVERWPDFMARANQIGIIQSGWLANTAHSTGQNRLRILASLVGQGFLTVNYFPVKAFYNSRLPMLDFLSGATFMLGIAYSLYHVTDRRHLLLHGWFWSGVVAGGALVVGTADAAYRIMIIFPAVCLFVALGWDRLIEFGTRTVKATWARPHLMTIVFVGLIAIFNLKAYFLDYASSCRYEDRGTRLASYMGQYLGKLGPEYDVYLFGAPRIYYGIHKSVDFLRQDDTSITDVRKPLAGPPDFVDPHSKAVFILIPDRQSELAMVRRYMPGGELIRKYDCGELLLMAYQVDGALR